MPGKDINSQLLFQLNDGLGDSGLGGMKCFGCLSEIEVTPSRLLDKSKLMQVHSVAP
jgi:hypothetical protein